MQSRLWWKLHYGPVLVLAIAGVLTGIAGIVYSATLTCDSGMGPADCAFFRNYNPPSSIVTLIIAVIPVVLGVILGVSTVASELEKGTSGFAWSISTSRRRWLIEQVVMSAVSISAVGMLCGVFNAGIVANISPGHNILSSFVGYGLWGPILVARGICAYGISILVGVALRRVVASVTLGFFISVVAIVLSLMIGRSFEPAHIIPNGDPAIGDSLGVTSDSLLPDGTLGSWDACVAFEPPGLSHDDSIAWETAHCAPVGSYLPGSQMPVVEARESASLLAFALAGLAGTRKLIAGCRP